MTTEPDLLPLPGPDYLMPQGQGWPDIPAWSENTVRQIVAHATAPLQAEIEALRAEVEKWKVPCLEWLDKTEWVQQTIKPRELGRHRADILRERIQRSEARAERLAEALRWALPLASQGLEMCRLERLRCGHGDITGTYKNGETWAGIHQEEVDGLERAHAALDQEEGHEQ